MSRAIDEYRFDAMANAIYAFFWTEFCDVFVELAKVGVDPHHRARQATRATLVHALDTSMRLLHPVCPFLTEEMAAAAAPRVPPGVAFCAVAPWPP